jgi:2'-5' RNA ligase
MSLEQCQRGIRTSNQQWADQKWVRPENLHVTIAFLGDVAHETVPALSETIRHAVVSSDSLEFAFETLQAAPRSRRASMIWAHVAEEGSITALEATITAGLAPFGFEPDKRPYVPHVTLVRARKPVQSPLNLDEVFDASGLRLLRVSDPEVTFFTSQLTPRGPQYSKIGSWKVKRA